MTAGPFAGVTEIKGVSLAVALSGLGQHWRQHSHCKGRTVSTDSYDNFLSHAWASSGWLKYLSLLILFNARAAMVSTILISVLIGVLRMMAILPNMVWTQLPCYVIYFSTLAMWQRIRDVFRSPRIVFLDRLCIPQDDEEKKSECIRGLAGYLDRAHTLTVLWSNEYFGRLWCVFELATFLRNRRSRPIQLLPVEMSMLAFLIGLCYSMVNLAYRTIMEARNMTVAGSLKTTPWLATLRASGWLALVGVPVIPCYIYLGLDFMMKLRLLPTQLRTFDARKASCYCCTVDHTDPQTKTPIFCDRKLIMEKLTEWYGDEVCEDTDMEIDGAIEQFNHLVRKELADVFLEMMSGRDVLWQYIYLLIGMNCPVCTYLLGDMGFPPDSMEGVITGTVIVVFEALVLVALSYTVVELIRAEPSSLQVTISDPRSKHVSRLALMLSAAADSFFSCWVLMVGRSSPSPFSPFLGFFLDPAIPRRLLSEQTLTGLVLGIILVSVDVLSELSRKFVLMAMMLRIGHGLLHPNGAGERAAASELAGFQVAQPEVIGVGTGVIFQVHHVRKQGILGFKLGGIAAVLVAANGITLVYS
ncbi:hypothetical protein AK812_SmicGene26356 [Symbiodinium microadriaticum]|uniref:Uncharacterized protein n=1 Tax=Symbiodinium microadriaticum TaxID=2951 RepID=A0A1Q9D9K4_SYMMI|nr:hypothetical protein AK812_SmicGene26356 [Symbiodinium microadriaticum]